MSQISSLAHKRRGYLEALIGAICASTFFIGVKLSASLVNPLIYFCLVFAIAGGATTVYIWLRGGRILERINWPDLKIILAKAVCGEVISPILLFVALGYTAASHGSLINAVQIIATFIFASILFKEILTRQRLAGMLIVLTGVMLITYNGGAINIGDIMLFLSAVSFGFDNAYTVKLSERVSTERVVQIKFLIGSAVLLVIALIFSARFISLGELPYLAFTALIPIALNLTLSTNAIRVIGASMEGLIFALSFPLGMIMAILIFHESVNLPLVFGSTSMIILGVYIALRS